MSSAAALVLYVLALVVLFVVRSWVQRRRTGSTGFHGVSGTPREAGWWGGVLFVVAVLLGLAAPTLAVIGLVRADPPPVLALAGPVVTLAGFAATLAGQAGMGASWRIGVDPRERTDLVTTGVFAHVRNPIFTAMVLAQSGMVLAVPTWIGAAALVALVVAVQLQVRAVEEPHLRRVHGDTYAAYAARTGRFLPGVGRGPGTAVTRAWPGTAGASPAAPPGAARGRRRPASAPARAGSADPRSAP